MLKIDIHTHILPEHIPNWAQKFGYGDFIHLVHENSCCANMMLGDKLLRKIDANCWAAEKRVKDCDKHNVHYQVLSTVPVMFNYWALPHDTLDISRFLNDNICETIAKFPNRFFGLGTLPMQAPKLAVQELERCMNELHLQGIEIGSHINDWNLDNEALFPIYEAAEALNAAIFVHPWDMMGKERMPDYCLPSLVGMPAETSLAICSLIFGGVFEKFPKLRFAFAHGGGSFPGTIGRIEHGFNVRPDLCATRNKVNPREYLGKFYVDSLVHDVNALKYLVNLVGADKVALGSDYPFPLGEHVPGNLIINSDFSEEEKKQLLAGTAIEFLGLQNISLENP